jgi:phosphoglycerol transferase MdoB-like AlkP superfamily enzyme
MKFPPKILTLLKRLSLLILLYSLCRIAFYLFNHTHFHSPGLISFLHGIRFDLSVIFVINAPLIILHIVPSAIFKTRYYQFILKFFFYLLNLPALAFNLIDLVYFQYTLKRTTFDIFEYALISDDIFNLIPQFFKDFWFLVILLVVFIIIIEIFYKKTFVEPKSGASMKFNGVLFLKSVGFFTFFSLLAVLSIRGGIQGKPIGVITAGKYSSAENIPLVLNTPFTIMKTIENQEIKPVNYFSDEEALALTSPYIQFSSDKDFNSKNVVILIMESFSSEYIGSISGRKSYTPFLDSIIGESYVFTNTYSNGKKSIEGIPAILASMPTWMNTPFITSSFSSNKINSLASILNKEGYHTSFFHGGNYGTMGFDDFCNIAGFKKYYGRQDYGTDKDFDGNWGVFDEPFLMYFADKLNENNQPFFSTIFTLSSHHPYTIPGHLHGKFDKGTLEIHESIQYADYALKKFFEKAAKQEWFKNTMFVITADHTGISNDPYYNTRLGLCRIPIIFYEPSGSLSGRDDRVGQQSDIMPTILDHLGYKKPFFAFGQSLFDAQAEGSALNYISSIYQLIEGDYLLQHDGESPHALYNYKSDSLLHNNIAATEDSILNLMNKKLKAKIQVYNNSLIRNRLTHPQGL